MEKEKYYAPTIDEFHVGFEFEKYDDRLAMYKINGEYQNTNWHQFKYDLKSIRLSQLGTHLYDKTIRVKHLDNLDIEYFGFNLMGREQMDNHKLFRQIPCYSLLSIEKNKCNGLIVLQHDWLNDKITIQTPNYIRDGSGRFNNYIIYVNSLKCKNKSELAKLLKQLSII